jgi:Flp pilus assembly protein TadB
MTAQAYAAQSRASAVVLAALPLVLSGPMLLFNHSARIFMLHTPLGVALLVSGLALDLAGVRWMSALIDGVQA